MKTINEDHDCHLSAEDGCEACEQMEIERRNAKFDEHKEKFPSQHFNSLQEWAEEHLTYQNEEGEWVI